MFGKYIPSDMSAEMQDQRLYFAWVEDYEKGEECHRRGTDTIREAEGDQLRFLRLFRNPVSPVLLPQRSCPRAKQLQSKRLRNSWQGLLLGWNYVVIHNIYMHIYTCI